MVGVKKGGGEGKESQFREKEGSGRGGNRGREEGVTEHEEVLLRRIALMGIPQHDSISIAPPPIEL